MNHEQALAKMEAQPLHAIDITKLGPIWEIIKPLLSTVGSIFGKKVRLYIRAFIALIDELVAKEDAEESRKGKKK